MRTKTIHNTKEYKVLILREFGDRWPCEGCGLSRKCIGRCLWKTQRNWKKYRKTQWKNQADMNLETHKQKSFANILEQPVLMWISIILIILKNNVLHSSSIVIYILFI